MRKDEVADLRRKIVDNVRRLAQGAHSEGEKPLNVLVDGFGSVAQHFAYRLTTGADELTPDLATLYFLVDGQREAEAYQRLLSKIQWQQGESRTINPHLTIAPISFSEAEQRMGEIDFYFFMADAAPPEILDRVERSRYNLPLIDERRAALFGASDSTLIDIVSSHPQILVQKAAALSHADPRRFFGSCHVDARRLRSFLYDRLTSHGLQIACLDDIDVHSGGIRDNPVALTHGACVRLRDNSVVSLAEILANLKSDELSASVRAYPSMMVRLARDAGLKTSPTAQQTVEALFDEVKARSDGRVITAAVYDEKHGVYVEGPATLDRLALPAAAYVDRMSPSEKVAVQKRVRTLEGYLDDRNLRATKLSVVGWDALKSDAVPHEKILQLPQRNAEKRRRHYFSPPEPFPWGRVATIAGIGAGAAALGYGSYYALQHADVKTVAVVGGLAALVGATVALLRNGDDIAERLRDARDFVAEAVDGIPWRTVGKIAAVTGAAAGIVVAGKYAYDSAPAVAGTLSSGSSTVFDTARDAYTSAYDALRSIPWGTVGKIIGAGAAVVALAAAGKYVWEGVKALYEKAEDLPWRDISKGLAVIGLIGVIGYSVYDFGQSQVRKQQQEKDAAFARAQQRYATVQRLRKEEPAFVQSVFGGKDEARYGFFLFRLADIEHVRYSSQADRGLFTTGSARGLSIQEQRSGELRSAELLGIFYNGQHPRVEIVLGGEALIDPKWIDGDTFQVTGINAFALPLNPRNRLGISLPNDYIVDLNPDNTAQLIREKENPVIKR
ncbi:MAG TPA: hypothetical protein VJH88_03520 [Candidatus Nanoarchaeia archaeon]|nr:hypothetical protein [Candidatus Nanoarchaeia archaeon]